MRAGRGLGQHPLTTPPPTPRPLGLEAKALALLLQVTFFLQMALSSWCLKRG